VHKPQHLERGARIGVVAPAGNVEPERLQAGVEAMRAEGFEVELAANLFASNGYLAGNPKQRADDLVAFFRRADIGAIFCARGGFGSVQLLPYLSSELRKYPKIFVGYSDITVLLNWLRQFCGMVTFHAPMVAMDIARGLNPRSKAYLWQVLTGELREWKVALGEIIRPGRVEAEMIGGCLSLLVTTLGTPYEIDMQGKVVWKMEVPHGLRPTRHRFASDLKWLSQASHFLYTSAPNGIFELDRGGKVTWSHRTAKVTHDADRLENGNKIYVFGFDSETDAQVTEISQTGQTVWEWRAKAFLEGEPRHEAPTTMRQVERLYSYGHTNAVTRLPNGNTLVSLRNFHMVVEVAPTGEIVWRWRDLRLVHDPEVLANGNLLVALRISPGYHPVREVTQDGKVVWEFSQPDIQVPTNCQRLPNGNTLVCEGDFGRFFEVTTEGELVWEYVNPYFGEGPNGSTNRVFRAYRYSSDEIAKAKATGGTQ